MTLEERVKRALGDLAVQVLSLETQLDEARAKIAELEAKVPKDD